jgi:hypothetical protein
MVDGGYARWSTSQGGCYGLRVNLVPGVARTFNAPPPTPGLVVLKYALLFTWQWCPTRFADINIRIVLEVGKLTFGACRR